MAEDKTLACSDCGNTFTFSADEQELFKSRGYTNEPKRCPSCRQARKSQRFGTSGGSSYSSGSSYGGQRQMYPVKCSACGKDAEVPFQPRGDKPVYCSDCYRKVKPAR